MPGLVLAVRNDLAGTITGIADLSGRRLGVTSLGSSTDFLARYLMRKAGIKADSVVIMAVGSGPSAVAAMERHSVDAIVTQDPAVTLLLNRGLIKPLIDTRTVTGHDTAFRGLVPTACLYTTEEFIKKNPVTIQRLVNALSRSLAWIDKTTPEDIAAIMPKGIPVQRPFGVHWDHRALEAGRPSLSIPLRRLGTLNLIRPSGAGGRVSSGKGSSAGRYTSGPRPS